MVAIVVQAGLALRGLQFILSLLALAFVSASFKTIDVGDYSTSLGSSAATFTQLVSYSAMFYALWYVVAVEIYQYVPRLTLQTDRIIDGIFAVCLFIAGIVLATSGYVSDCDMYEAAIRCGNLKAGVWFTFFAMLAFLPTFGINFLGGASAAGASGQTTTTTTITTEYVQVATPYQETSTPKDALSPIGGAKSPEAHV